MRPAAIDCVRRGLRNTRANRELIVVRWLSSLVLVVVLAAGLAPVFLVLGFTAADLPSRPEGWEELGSEMATRISEASAGLLAAGLAAACIWTLAFVGFCFVQAGTYGVLYAGDRQAPPGLPAESSWFRTYSRADFSGWGARLVWRFFWFANLYACLLLVPALLAVLLLAAAAWASAQWGVPAGIGLGCGGALPLLFALVSLGLWFALAQADLPREGGGVFSAARRGLRALGRRLGGVLLIVLLMVMASTAVAIVFAPFSILANVALEGRFAAHLAARALLFTVQSLVSSGLSVVLAASLIALMRGEAEGVKA
jgi:hypothetical protein